MADADIASLRATVAKRTAQLHKVVRALNRVVRPLPLLPLQGPRFSACHKTLPLVPLRPLAVALLCIPCL